MKLKRLGAAIMAAAMTIGASGISTFAATDTVANGSYTGVATMYQQANPTATSMCNLFFCNYAGVTVTDDATEITLRVISPVSMGTTVYDPTLTDVTLTYNDVAYTAVSEDVSYEDTIVATQDFAIVGITAGESYTYQEMVFELPADAVDALDDGIAVSAYVNAVMASTQNFILKVTDMTLNNVDSSKSMEITASIEPEAVEPSYTVVVPESIALGTLSAETDNSQAYTVKVATYNLAGTISVTAPETGSLTSGENTLAFANSFGTQSVTDVDSTGVELSGNISVTAADVAAAASGNYTGTTTFAISYAAS